MLRNLRALCDSNSVYDSQQFAEDCYAKYTCGVFCDADDVEDRFCSCKRKDQHQVDYCSCGYVGEMETKGSTQYRKDSLKRWIGWGYFLQFLFWVGLGGMMLVFPETSTFNVVMVDANMEALNVGGFHQYQIESDHLKKHEDTASAFSVSNLISHMDIGTIFSKIAGNTDTTEDEKEQFIHKLDVVTQDLTMRAARSAIVTPTRNLGAVFIFFGLYSLVKRSHPIPLDNSVSAVHLLWNICNILGLASAASGTSGNYVLTMLLINAFSAGFWAYIYHSIITMQIPKKANEESDDDGS